MEVFSQCLCNLRYGAGRPDTLDKSVCTCCASRDSNCYHGSICSHNIVRFSTPYAKFTYIRVLAWKCYQIETSRFEVNLCVLSYFTVCSTPCRHRSLCVCATVLTLVCRVCMFLNMQSTLCDTAVDVVICLQSSVDCVNGFFAWFSCVYPV